jgi:hypothetical protein
MRFFSVGQASFEANQLSVTHVVNRAALAHLRERVVHARAEYARIDRSELYATNPYVPDPVAVQCLRLQAAEISVWDNVLQFVEAYQAALVREGGENDDEAVCQHTNTRATNSSHAALLARLRPPHNTGCAEVLRTFFPYSLS